MEQGYHKRAASMNLVCQSCVIEEDLTQPEHKTFFYNEYRQAALAIKRIIDNNDKYLKKPRKYPNFETVIPFIGDRGTGKTSAMFSVLQALNNNPDEFFEYCEVSIEKTHFVCFEMIDVETMRCNENIISLILSHMLNYLKSLERDKRFGAGSYDDHSSKLRDIYRDIDSLFRTIGQRHSKREQFSTDQGLAGLQKIYDAQSAIPQFQELVRAFTDVVKQFENVQGTCNLVIALDDIDLFLGDGVEKDDQFILLEQIYDFLKAPNLIVMMTFNERVLRRNCQNHFWKFYLYGSKVQESSVSAAEADYLTRQFLSKLFPQEQRIYMPNFAYINFANESELAIKVIQPDNNLSIQPFKTGEVLPVKEFMLKMIAYKTGVYFDIMGSKKHFLEPRNLRELGKMLNMVLHWRDPKAKSSRKGSEKLSEIQRQNRTLFLNYLRYQFAGEYLSAEEYALFQRLSEIPLVRQNRLLVDEIRNYREHVAPNETDFGFLNKTQKDRWKYSYGELLQNLYFSTRINNLVGAFSYARDSTLPSSKTTFYSKEFVQCILGCNSVILNQMVLAPDLKGMREVLGSSIAGRWANDMLPIFWTDTNKSATIGSISAPISAFLGFEVPKNIQKQMIGPTTKNLAQNPADKAQNELKQYVDALILVGMFFTHFPASGLGIRFTPDLNSDTGNQISLVLSSSSVDYVCFNVLNPVLNVYTFAAPEGDDSQSYLDYIHQKLEGLTTNFAVQMIDNLNTQVLEKKTRANARGNLFARDRDAQSEIIQQLENTVDEISKYSGPLDAFTAKWEKAVDDSYNYFRIHLEKKKLILPVQHFDIMYNITKRMANVSYHDIPSEASVAEAYDYVGRLYEGIARELEAQDITYGALSMDFAKTFRDSLFFKVLVAEPNNELYNPFFKELFTQMMKRIVSSIHTRKYTGAITPNPTRSNSNYT